MLKCPYSDSEKGYIISLDILSTVFSMPSTMRGKSAQEKRKLPYTDLAITAGGTVGGALSPVKLY